ncbi:MAG: hypothetical protein KIT80_17785 [Chitinophagaceae bacterium]|nr:hypothetical protein [Chitinophagaceae bacterium]MCW5928776.1 hypothetical protein [Chitinophagaceae bacterium]
MQTVLKPLNAELVSLSSNLTADSLLSVMKTFSKNNSNFSLELVFGDYPNLDVLAKSNYQIEISPLWQFIKIPGYGMNVKIKGTIISEGQHSKINATIRPHIFYPILFWTIAGAFLFSIVYTLTNGDTSIHDMIPILASQIILEVLLLLFCRHCKRKLIKDVQKNFNLTEIDQNE